MTSKKITTFEELVEASREVRIEKPEITFNFSISNYNFQLKKGDGDFILMDKIGCALASSEDPQKIYNIIKALKSAEDDETL